MSIDFNHNIIKSSSFGGKVKLNAVLKKKIINISSDFLASFAVLTASVCLISRIKSMFPMDVNNISLMAAKSILPRGNINFSSKFMNISRNKINSNNVSESSKSTVNNNFTEKDSQSSMPLPNFERNDDEEYHSPDEPRHKIIESQFSSGGIKFENFYVKNTTGQNINIGEELGKKPEINITNTKEPQVLIFHTHTSESYVKRDEGFFYESFYPRSLNNEKNVTRVGQAITDKLIENGINTIHDITYHDNPTYNGSYSRSAQTIKKNLEKYPSIQVVIDIHRDSLGSKETGKIKPTFKYQNKKAAQLMVICGCDPDGSLGFPNWEKNLRLALRVQKYCETLFPGITRPLNFSKVKYNEHLTPGSLLIEVGSDANTLEEAVYTGSMLGESLSKMLNDLKK